MSPHPLEVRLTMSVAEQVAGSHVNREHTVENDAPGHRGRYLSLSRWRAVGHLRDSFTLVGVPDGWGRPPSRDRTAKMGNLGTVL